MKISTTIIAILTTFLITAQNKVKIDSVFKRNFYILELELKGSKNFDADKEVFFNEIMLDNYEKAYTNKYLGNAINFFQTITEISAPIKHQAQTLRPYIDEKTLKDWKDWYALNRKKIKWCENEKAPYLKKK